MCLLSSNHRLEVVAALLVGSEEHKSSETDPRHPWNKPRKQPAAERAEAKKGECFDYKAFIDCLQYTISFYNLYNYA